MNSLMIIFLSDKPFTACRRAPSINIRRQSRSDFAPPDAQERPTFQREKTTGTCGSITPYGTQASTFVFKYISHPQRAGSQPVPLHSHLIFTHESGVFRLEMPSKQSPPTITLTMVCVTASTCYRHGNGIYLRCGSAWTEVGCVCGARNRPSNGSSVPWRGTRTMTRYSYNHVPTPV